MDTDSQWLATMPEVYDTRLGPALFAPFAVRVAEAAARLAPRRVLELAAGTGILTAELLRALPDAAVTATDLNPAMVSWAASRVRPGYRPTPSGWTCPMPPSTWWRASSE